MLTHILKTKQQKSDNIFSDRMKFRHTFSNKKAKILWEIKPKKPLSEKYFPAKYLAEKLLKNPDIAGFSILIDETFFGGNITNIELVRNARKPTLFKEFVYETRQIDGAHYYGYDAVLLIKKIFQTVEELKSLVAYCLTKNIEPLIEVDNPGDLDEILKSFSPEDITLGINCRNLDTMKIDRKKHFDFWRSDLNNYHALALSGITDFAQLNEYQWKYDGVLIGTLFTY